MTTVETIATAATAAVRADYRAGTIRKGIETFEAAHAELAVRLDAAGLNPSRLVRSSLAQQVAAKAVA